MPISLLALGLSILVAYLLYIAITKTMKVAVKIILVLVIAYLIYPYIIQFIG